MAKRGPDAPAGAGMPERTSIGRLAPAASPPPPPVTPEETLTSTFNSLRDELVSTLAYVLGNREEAADAAQDTFLKCWKARQTVPEVQNLRAWIFRVGLNTARDIQRSGWSKRAKPLIAEEVLLPARDVAPADTMEDQETIAQLRLALLELRPEEREVFLLRQNGELTYEQIAEMRSVPVGTVKTQMRTALIKLRNVLNPNPEESDRVPGDG